MNKRDAFTEAFLITDIEASGERNIPAGFNHSLIEYYLKESPACCLNIFNASKQQIEDISNLLVDYYSHACSIYLVDCEALVEGFLTSLRDNAEYFPDFDKILSGKVAFIIKNIDYLSNKPQTQEAMYYKFIIRWYDSYRHEIPMVFIHSCHDLKNLQLRLYDIIKSGIQLDVRES